MLSLAFWIRDEGSFNKTKGHLILYSDSYSKEGRMWISGTCSSGREPAAAWLLQQVYLLPAELQEQQLGCC
jgi:chemotaxis methyl-accepting protein methylase